MANGINQEMYFKDNGKLIFCDSIKYTPFTKAIKENVQFAGGVPEVQFYHDHSSATAGTIELVMTINQNNKEYALTNWYNRGAFAVRSVECVGYKGGAVLQKLPELTIGTQVSFMFTCQGTISQ